MTEGSLATIPVVGLRVRLAGEFSPLEAELLLAHALGVGRSWLYAHPEHRPDAATQKRLTDLLEARRSGVPMAYLLGEREFFGLPLSVGPEVLVPRPETETLVETALAWLRDRSTPRVADLGTGSGAIALAIQQARPDATVIAVERCPLAAERARDNARRLTLPVQVRIGDWQLALDGEPDFDLIVSNPPYLADNDPHLQELRHEPHAALVAGPGGLEAMASVIAVAVRHLVPGGALAVEHGADQGEAVRGLLAAAGLTELRTCLDLGHRERVGIGTWHPAGRT